jgi:hypothetical protein
MVRFSGGILSWQLCFKRAVSFRASKLWTGNAVNEEIEEG